VHRGVIVAVAVGLVVLAGAGAFLIVDFDDRRDVVDVDRNPSAPPLPATLTDDTVTRYGIAYEEIRLYNDILAAHSHSLLESDGVIAVCRGDSVTETAEAFRLTLRCAGGLGNREKPDRQEVFNYRVTYRVTGTTIQQVDVRGFPYDERDVLRPRRPGRSDNRTDDWG
jgi:hypothetical protein